MGILFEKALTCRDSLCCSSSFCTSVSKKDMATTKVYHLRLLLLSCCCFICATSFIMPEHSRVTNVCDGLQLVYSPAFYNYCMKIYRHERGAKPMQCESLRAGCMFGPRYVNGEITCECLTGMEFLDGGELFQGDIQLSEVSLEYIEYTFEHFVSRGDVTVKPRVFLPQWGQDGAAKRMVPFVVEALDRSDQDQIRVAVREFERTKCARFRELKSRPTDERHFLEFVNSDNTCSAPLGQSMAGAHTVRLAEECFYGANRADNHQQRSNRAIIHLLMHVLGFDHEENRFDRDAHLDIKEDNVQRGFLGQMRKKQPDRLDYHTLRYTKYDPLSVTAMGEFMFSGSEQTYVLKGGITNTETPSDENILSDEDIRRIDNMYKC